MADERVPVRLTPPNTDAPSDEDIATARVDVVFMPSPDEWYFDNGLDETDLGDVFRTSNEDPKPLGLATIASPITRQSAPMDGAALVVGIRGNFAARQPSLAIKAVTPADPVQDLLADAMTISCKLVVGGVVVTNQTPSSHGCLGFLRPIETRIAWHAQRLRQAWGLAEDRMPSADEGRVTNCLQ